MTKQAYWEGVDPLPGGNMDEGDIHTCRSLLVDVLACLRAQSWNYQTAHWQTAGVPAYGNHLLFERLYKSVQDEIDTLAEKLVGYFGLHAVDPCDVMDRAHKLVKQWKAYSTCHVERGLHAEEHFQSGVSNAYHQIKQKGRMTLGLDDFLMAAANNHESHTYLLQQLLVDINKLNDAYKEMGEAPYKDMTPPYKTATLEDGVDWSAWKGLDGKWNIEGDVTAAELERVEGLIKADLSEKCGTPHGGWGGEMSSMEKSWGGFSSFRPVRRGEREDQIPGGLGDKAKTDDFDIEQVLKGVDVELEHTTDPDIALEIALDHLTEHDDYYTRLEKVEKHAAIGDRAAPSVEYLFRDDPKRYELTEFVKSKAVTNLDNDPATPPTPVEIKDEPGGKALSTLHRYVVDTEEPAAKDAEGIEEHPPLSDFKDWTTVREK